MSLKDLEVQIEFIQTLAARQSQLGDVNKFAKALRILESGNVPGVVAVGSISGELLGDQSGGWYERKDVVPVKPDLDALKQILAAIAYCPIASIYGSKIIRTRAMRAAALDLQPLLPKCLQTDRNAYRRSRNA